MKERIAKYLANWKARGYPDDIPDEVPPELMRLGLAPSYKAIAMCILKNDHACQSLGFTNPPSVWYGVLKQMELEARG